MANWTGLTALLENSCLNSFGEDVVYLPKGLAAEIPMTGIFEAEYQELDLSTQAHVGSTQPMVEVLVSDLPRAPMTGDQVVIRSLRYRVAKVKSDGQGTSQLFLKEDPV